MVTRRLLPFVRVPCFTENPWKGILMHTPAGAKGCTGSLTQSARFEEGNHGSMPHILQADAWSAIYREKWSCIDCIFPKGHNFWKSYPLVGCRFPKKDTFLETRSFMGLRFSEYVILFGNHIHWKASYFPKHSVFWNKRSYFWSHFPKGNTLRKIELSQADHFPKSNTFRENVAITNRIFPNRILERFSCPFFFSLNSSLRALKRNPISAFRQHTAMQSLTQAVSETYNIISWITKTPAL